MRRVLWILVVCSVVACPASKEAARRWVRAKFLGDADSGIAGPHLMVYLKAGRIDKNRISGRKFQIAGKDFEGGIAMPSTGELLVRLPGRGTRFEATVGVDSNDLGYYSNAGRGNVIASVNAVGKEAFRSGILHEGMPGVAVSADLGGATEFTLKLEATGERSRTYQAAWDQADWADARVTLTDGRIIGIADLPVGPLAGPYTVDPPFSFRYRGRPSTEILKTWILRRESRRIDEQRTEHTLTYTDPQTGLVARAVAVAYDDFPTVEWTLYLKNGGTSATPIIEDVQAIDTRFERTLDREFILHYANGSHASPSDYQPLETTLGPNEEKRLAAKGGRPTNAVLSFFNFEWAGHGVIVALGWPGEWAARFNRDEGAGIRIRAGQELTHFLLLPGEEVRTPLVALQFWEGDWIAAQNTWRRWIIAHNLPRPGGTLPKPQVAGGSNRHTIEMQDADEANQLLYLKRDLDAGLPIDYWWMDAGWYPFQTGWWQTGTWRPDPKRFPKGLAPVTEAAHARGVKTVLWFEPERVAPGSWLYENHPEWLIGADGRDKLLYLGNPEARQWLIEHISKLIREQGIDLYRQDFNFEPLSLWRSHDADDRQGITEIRHVTGYLAYWDELRRRFPNVPIDTCASGGGRNDLETLRRGVPLWRSDHAYEPSSMQLMTYGMSLWIPYFGTAVNSLDPYFFRSQMTPAIGIGLEPGRHPDGYARLNRLIAQWHTVVDYFYGDFYPLTPYSDSDSEWIAWQFDRPERADGMVQAFRRPESAFEAGRFKLRGLDGAAKYTVTDLDSQSRRILSGRELMERGVPLTIEDRPGAVILTYTKQ